MIRIELQEIKMILQANRNGDSVDAKTLMSPAQTAEILHTTTGTLAQRRYLGYGPAYVKVGSKILYRLADIETFIEEHTVSEVGKRSGAA